MAAVSTVRLLMDNCLLPEDMDSNIQRASVTQLQLYHRLPCFLGFFFCIFHRFIFLFPSCFHSSNSRDKSRFHYNFEFEFQKMNFMGKKGGKVVQISFWFFFFFCFSQLSFLWLINIDVRNEIRSWTGPIKKEENAKHRLVETRVQSNICQSCFCSFMPRFSFCLFVGFLNKWNLYGN